LNEKNGLHSESLKPSTNCTSIWQAGDDFIPACFLSLPTATTSMSNIDLLQQAALVLKSLPKREAAQIISKLEAHDLKKVMRESNELGNSDLNQVNSALGQLTVEAKPLCSTRRDKRRLMNSRLRHGSECPDKIKAGPFAFMIPLETEVRRELMANEHPENVALVMMHLPTEMASELLRSLESPLQVSTVRRLCEFQDECRTQVDELAFTLRMRLQQQKQRVESQTGVHLAGQLLSCSDGGTREEVLEYINQLDPSLVGELEKSIFRFENIRNLDDLDILVILKHVDTTFWAPALKPASKQVRDKLLGNMAPQVAKMLNHEISEMQLSDEQVALHAQAQIVKVCVQLSEQNKIDLPTV
jgi:flagellar motor switch protein FliG